MLRQNPGLFRFGNVVVTSRAPPVARPVVRSAAMGRGSEQERGQATVEWVGLVLGVALALGAVVAGGREAAKGDSSAGLGTAVAERITCAVRDGCGGERALGPPGGASLAPRAAPGARRRAGRGPRAPRGGPGAPRGPLAPRAAPGRRPSPPPAARSAAAVRRTSGGSPLLGGAGELAKHAWIACFGYRRWRYEV
ncbi:MAG: hypothetical protein QOI45_1916, partial [Thermoleophilaceae bacterium]|nr:hypothetical protein [Thermoleophilaceae bacterium]